MKYHSVGAILLGFLLTSCSGEKDMTNRYYLIEMPEAESLEAEPVQPLLEGTCEIARVDVDPVYERNQIVNRTESHEITYYKYHLWALRPSAAVRDLMLALFEQAGIFSDVSERYSLSVPDYIFHTKIRKMEVIEDRNRLLAHLSIRFSLKRNSDQATMQIHEADRTVPLAERDLNLFAAEINRIIFEEFEAFRLKLREAVSPQEINP